MAMTPEEVHNYLEHHGIKGMRWGIRRTPEELGHKLKARNARHYGHYNKAVAKIGKIQGNKTVNQLTTKEKEKMVKEVEKAQSYLKKMASDEKKYGKKIAKAEARETEEKEKTAAKEAAKAAEDQKLKEKLLKKQKWEDIYKNKEIFTTQELSDVATRINAEKRVQDALESNQMDKLAKKVNSAANLVGSGVNLYNKVKDVQNIFESGQREKAYKEIRKLMAEGNNAEVIKKSVGIADGDVEKFTKRATFLKTMNAGLGIEYKGGSNKESSSKKDGGGIIGAIKNKIENEQAKAAGRDALNKMYAGLDKSTKKYYKNAAEKLAESYASSSGMFANTKETIFGGTSKGTVEGLGNSFKNKGSKSSFFDSEVIDVPYTEVKNTIKSSPLIKNKDSLLMLTMNDIGDYPLGTFLK